MIVQENINISLELTPNVKIQSVIGPVQRLYFRYEVWAGCPNLWHINLVDIFLTSPGKVLVVSVIA